MSVVRRMLARTGAGLHIAAALAVIAGLECSSPNDASVQIPPVPTGVNAVAESDTAVSLSWTAVQGATEYVVYRDGIAVDTLAQAQFTDADLATCTSYSYQVAALNSGGLSVLSPAVSASLLPPVPAVPAGVGAVTTSETAVSVSWTAVQGATGYVVYRDGIATDTTAQTQSPDSGLAMCAGYSYQVAALNRCILSQLSPAVSVSLIPQPIPGTGGILLEEPNGCVDYKVGDTMDIDWELDSLRDGLVIRFSSDGGLTFMIIGDALASRAYYQHGPYRWVIPDSVYAADGSAMPTVSDSCVVKIHEYWASGLKDQSDRMFRIRAP